MPNFVALSPGVSEEIANTHERMSYFIYIDILEMVQDRDIVTVED